MDKLFTIIILLFIFGPMIRRVLSKLGGGKVEQEDLQRRLEEALQRAKREAEARRERAPQPRSARAPQAGPPPTLPLPGKPPVMTAPPRVERPPARRPEAAPPRPARPAPQRARPERRVPTGAPGRAPAAAQAAIPSPAAAMIAEGERSAEAAGAIFGKITERRASRFETFLPRDQRDLARMVVLHEVLSRPRALRRWGGPGGLRF